MDSVITIDGIEVVGNVDFIEQLFVAVTEIIDSGIPETVTIGDVVGDYRTRVVFHITATTRVSAALAWNPAETIPDHLESATIIRN